MEKELNRFEDGYLGVFQKGIGGYRLHFKDNFTGDLLLFSYNLPSKNQRELRLERLQYWDSTTSYWISFWHFNYNLIDF